MDNKDYQTFCSKKVKDGYTVEVFALGLGGETGEVLDIIKKSRRDKKPIDINHMKEELGDVYWYLANLCTSFGFSIDEVLEYNINKLKERYKV